MISPATAVVDRTIEDAAEAVIDTELALEWGRGEISRRIGLPNGIDFPMAECIARCYKAVGWSVVARIDQTKDSCLALDFSRPHR